MPIRMKVYHQGKETLVAAADADLIGKTFREGKFKIEVGKFYEGDVVSEEVFASRLQLATIGNFVGSRPSKRRNARGSCPTTESSGSTACPTRSSS